MGIIKTFLLSFGVWIIVLTYSPLFLDFEPEEYPVTEELAPSFTGPLALNDELAKTVKVYHNSVHGPESFAVHQGSIYTGLLGGSIVKLNNGSVEEFVRTGTKCAGVWDESSCGRPLGIKFDRSGENMYVADAFKGLLKIDMASKKIKVLVEINELIDGERLTVPNDLVLDEDSGKIYLSDSSTRWSLDCILYDILERKPTGRVLSYDIATGQAKTLVKGFKFVNGLELTKNKDSLLIVETFAYKIHRFWLIGPKSSTLETFVSHLPGMPDNIRSSESGGYWIGMISGLNKDSPGILQRLGPLPILRKFLARFSNSVASLAACTIDLIAPNNLLFKTYNNYLYRMQFLYFFVKPHGIVVKIDEKGNIIKCLHATEGDPAFISEVLEHEGKLLLGSYRNNYVGVYDENVE